MQIIIGKHAIEEALRAEIPIREVVISNSLLQQPAVKTLLHNLQTKKILLTRLHPKEFKQRFDDSQNQQIVAYTKSVPIQPIDKLFAHIDRYPLLICCDHLQDPFNFGAIIRSTYALGGSGILFPKDRQVPITSGVLKASSGAAYHLDLFQVANLGNTLKKLKQEGYWVFGADQKGASLLQKTSFSFPAVLIVGNEQKGISPTLQKYIDQNVSIQMKGQLDSLNVSVSTGILLHEMIRQHEKQ